MTITLPSSFANSARSYMSSMVAGGHVQVVALDLAGLRPTALLTASIANR